MHLLWGHFCWPCLCCCWTHHLVHYSIISIIVVLGTGMQLSWLPMFKWSGDEGAGPGIVLLDAWPWSPFRSWGDGVLCFGDLCSRASLSCSPFAVTAVPTCLIYVMFWFCFNARHCLGRESSEASPLHPPSLLHFLDSPEDWILEDPPLQLLCLWASQWWSRVTANLETLLTVASVGLLVLRALGGAFSVPSPLPWAGANSRQSV